jgi:large subunit ribosomal protein L10
MNRTEKQTEVKNLREKIEGKNFLLANYQGLTVGELQDLRTKLRKVSSEFKVVKNRLLNIVLKDLKLDGFQSHLKNTTGVCVQPKDSLDGIKILADFAKTNEKFSIKAGAIDGKFVNESDLTRIAKLPSKQVLVSMLLTRMNAPMSKFVYALQFPINKLVFAIEAIKREKEKK